MNAQCRCIEIKNKNVNGSTPHCIALFLSSSSTLFYRIILHRVQYVYVQWARLIEFWSSFWFNKRSSSFVAPYMALFNMNALSVAMNAEQDVAVRALKLQLEKTQLALERARMSMEDARAAILREEYKDTSDNDDADDEMETETESNTVRVPRTSFCEVCDNYWDERTVVWYDRPFAHEGRNLYSACYRCRSQMGHNFEHINVNFIVDARRATDGTNSEMESESDQESDTRQSAR